MILYIIACRYHYLKRMPVSTSNIISILCLTVHGLWYLCWVPLYLLHTSWKWFIGATWNPTQIHLNKQFFWMEIWDRQLNKVVGLVAIRIFCETWDGGCGLDQHSFFWEPRSHLFLYALGEDATASTNCYFRLFLARNFLSCNLLRAFFWNGGVHARLLYPS